ncbi:MAG: hypothetical protein OXG60_08125 [Chloroflexi bacterium]|nr:hypothetical protein [Chloroflexota bacterium]
MRNEMRDYRDYQKRKLSGSTDGRGIKVAASGSPGTLVHTALSSVAANEWDEIFFQAVNTHTSDVKLTVEWGGTDSPGDLIEVTIPAESGFTEVIPGHVLQNGALVRAFAAETDVIVLHGYVNRYQHI